MPTRPRPPVAAPFVTASLTLVVVGLVAVMAAAPASAHGGAHEDAADPVDAPYTAVIDLTFPVAGETHYSDSYDAPRGGGTRVHKATDIMADHGQSVHAAMGGTVGWITGVDSAVPSYGYMLSIDGDDGRRYSYIHLGRQDLGPEAAYVDGIAEGVRVERGQHLGWVGCSGNASCDWPHLHFAVEDDAVTDPYGTHLRNPYASLRAAEERGDLPRSLQPAPPADAPTGQPVSAPGDDSCAPTGAVPDTPVTRVGDRDPVVTSVAVSRAGWTRADEVLVATAGDFADALAGAALAAERRAPLLLVDDTLPGAMREEVARLGVRRVTVLGGPAAVPDAVVTALDDTVAQVERVWGEDRFLTAAAIHELLGQDSGEIILALGRHRVPGRSWPDAISAGALAAGEEPLPVVLSRDDRLPAPTRARLVAAREAGATGVLVVGGPEAIATGIDTELEAIGLAVQRLQGATRYETSLEVAAATEARGGGGDAFVAVSGSSYTDALPGGPLAAHIDGTLLLVPSCSLDTVPGVAAFVDGRYGDGYVIGAEGAVSERVREVLTDAIAD